MAFSPELAIANDHKNTHLFRISVNDASLSDAIRKLSKQTNTEILATLPQDERSASGIDGIFSVEDALRALIGDRAYSLKPVLGGYVLNVRERADRSQQGEDDTAPQYSARSARDIIVVSEFRKSIADALDIKRASPIVQDTIVAYDIARFPDLNLAEALQRIPGVTITRERGEGHEISLRGLGPDFTRVQLNGMEVLANTDRDRGFEFNVFAAELFSQVDVKKAYTAALDEGGIAGTVQLNTPRPFDLAKEKISLSVNAGSNTNAGAFDHRVAALFSKRNDTFGALLALAYTDRTSQGQDASTFRYRARDFGDADITNLDPDLQARLNNEEIFIPRGNRYRVSTEQQDRLGLSASMQWRGRDQFSIDINGLYSRYDVDRNAENIQTRGINSFPTQGALDVDGLTFSPTLVEELRINQNDEVVYGVFRGANIGAESTRQEETCIILSSLK